MSRNGEVTGLKKSVKGRCCTRLARSPVEAMGGGFILDKTALLATAPRYEAVPSFLPRNTCGIVGRAYN